MGDNFEGKAALITGASRGIGEAAARALARAGAAVALAARSAGDIERIADEITKAGGRAQAITCDVTRYADVEAAVLRTVDAFGAIDILVNNAGVIEPIARIADSDPDGWDEVVDINLKGAYHAIRASLPPMLAAGEGVIVNISSGAATNAIEAWSHYCATKAGLLSLTQCTDHEYRSEGITVLGLSPGTVATEMQVQIRASGINPVSQLDPAVHISTDKVADAIVWLCTEDAREFAGKDVSLRDEAIRARAGISQ